MDHYTTAKSNPLSIMSRGSVAQEKYCHSPRKPSQEVSPPSVTADELLSSYRRLIAFYAKAATCGLPREMEHLSELILHLLHEDNCPLDDIYRLFINTKSGLPEVLRSSNQLEHQTTQRLKEKILIDEWNWRRIRSLFLQHRYSVTLDEIDKACGDEYFRWSYNVVPECVSTRFMANPTDRTFD